jgi:hypothetical protein
MLVYMVFSMDYEMRGIIHKYIDNYVNGGLLNGDLILWNHSEHAKLVDVKSALLGQVFGGALRMLANLNGVEEEELSEVDRGEIRELFSSTVKGIEPVVEAMVNHS